MKVTPENLIQLYRFPELAVVLGRGSDPRIELHLDACLEDGIALYRRRGGGCAVVLDTGNVIVSVVLPVTGLGRTKQYFKLCTAWLIEGLSRMGVGEIYQDGISDLVIENRKIAGSSVWRSKDFFYYSASLLITPDLTLIQRYLKQPPREPAYRQGREHKDFLQAVFPHFNSLELDKLVTNLSHHLNLESLRGH